jgi:hypothetical protein
MLANRATVNLAAAVDSGESASRHRLTSAPVTAPPVFPQQEVAASEPVAPPLEPKSRRGAQTIAAKWMKWKKQKARHS